MRYALTIAPLALIALETYLLFILGTGARSSVTILAVYELSVLRTLPLFGWLAGPFALVLTVVGEVLFFLQPDPLHPSSIRRECLDRLAAAVSYAIREAGAQEVVVIAHSQGSVIAAELRRQGKLPCALLTLGSPVFSLYKGFLAIELRSGGPPWVNAYRDGDYISGPIAGVPNKNIGSGGHIGYWKDPQVNRLLQLFPT